MKKTIYSKPNKALVAWLKSCRLKKGLTLRTFAERLKVPHSVVQKIENQERRLDLVEYIQICQILEVDPHEGIDVIMQTCP